MEVNVRVRREHDGVCDPVAAPHELREAPLQNGRRLSLVLRAEFGDSHVVQTSVTRERYTAVNPPSTAQTAPVTYDASSEARNAMAAATSSGPPIRPSGMRRFASAS